MHSTRILVIALLLGVGCLTVNACSGKTTSDGSSGGITSDGGGSDSGTGTPNNPDCPATDPQEGPCAKDGVVCEYGDDFNPLCNTLRVCSGTHWAQPITYSNRPTCPTTAPPTVSPNPAECAATRASVPVGMACTKSGDGGGTTCLYDGSTCTCGVFCASSPVARPDCDPDAGVTDNCCDRSKVEWHCFDGPPFCKAPRARVGSACTTEGDKCALTEPGECGQPILECNKGVWTLPNVSCPISTRRAKDDIAYVGRDDTARLHDELMSTRLATYRYKRPAPLGMGSSDARHLGFIIEDMPEGSAAVLPSRDQVDLYGYTSMTVASLQHQQREIDELKAELARMREENRACRSVERGGSRALGAGGGEMRKSLER
jgi:hypothetical protein